MLFDAEVSLADSPTFVPLCSADMAPQQELGTTLGFLVEESKGQTYPVNKQSLVIGRDRNADIRIINAEVSRIHGYVKVDEANKKV